MMKKFRLLPVVLVMFSVLSLTSCDTEPVDPVLDGNENVDPGTDPDTDPDTDPGTSEGDYWPFAINNKWVFKQDGELNEPMKITSTQTVENKTYYKISNFFANAGTGEFTGTATMLLRKDGGNYSTRVSVEIPEQQGMSISISPFEYIILKDNLNAGETWTDTATQVTSFNMPGSPVPLPDVVMALTFDGKVLEKGGSVTVNGTAYTDVIKVSLKQTAVTQGDLGGTIPPTVTNSEIWFAKGVGPIKSIAVADGLNVIQELDSYIVN